MNAVKYYLTRMVEGAPAFTIGPNAPYLRKGFLGGYKFKEVRTGGIAGKKRYHEVPDKNFYSHVSDALQYAMLHIREGIQQARNSHSFVSRTKQISQPDMGAWN